MSSDEPRSGPDRSRPAKEDRDEKLRVITERIADVPRQRLGEVLRNCRRRSGRSVAQAALRCDLLQRWLLDVEAGRFSCDADVVADLLDAYGADVDEVLPPRRSLLALDGVDTDDVLRRYVAALQRWRGVDAVARLRTKDLEVLSALTGSSPAAIERRLLRISKSGGGSRPWWVPTWIRWARRSV